jgi:hypothetical protein
MTSPQPAGSAREAVERNAQALASGNIAVVLADVTPEAIMQMMQAAAQRGLDAGAVSLASMPSVRSYEIVDAGKDGESETFHVTFVSDQGRATMGSTWKPIDGVWKIVGLEVISIERNEPAA